MVFLRGVLVLLPVEVAVGVGVGVLRVLLTLEAVLVRGALVDRVGGSSSMSMGSSPSGFGGF